MNLDQLVVIRLACRNPLASPRPSPEGKGGVGDTRGDLGGRELCESKLSA